MNRVDPLYLSKNCVLFIEDAVKYKYYFTNLLHKSCIIVQSHFRVSIIYFFSLPLDFCLQNFSTVSTYMMISGLISSMWLVLYVYKRITAASNKLGAIICFILFIIFATGLIRNIDRDISFQCIFNTNYVVLWIKLRNFFDNSWENMFIEFKDLHN